jgi:hypothetical protein
VARALGALPRLAQALARGELSYAKVRALTRVATPETEERLLAVGSAGTAEHVERIVRGWRRVDRNAEAMESAKRHAGRGLHMYQDEDGMVVVRGRLASEVGAMLIRALAAARETLCKRARIEDADADLINKNVSAETPGDVSGETPTIAQQQADALGLLAETAFHHGIDPGAPGGPFRPRGRPACPRGDVPAPGMRREPRGHATRRGRSRDGGRRADADNPAGAASSASLSDRGCRVPGCGRQFGQGHHIRHWVNGGATTLSNLALLCRRHHRAVHEDGYQMERQPDGELRFWRPDGRLLPDLPSPATVPADPVHALRARHAAQGLYVGPRTAMPGWLGEHLDVGYAIDVPHPLAG